MNIFEIVSLNENIERVPAVPGMYRVIYPDEMGRVPDIVQGQEAAQRKYDTEVDKWNSLSDERKRAERERQRIQDRNNKERAREARERERQKTDTPAKRTQFANGWKRAIRRATASVSFLSAITLSDEVYDQMLDRAIEVHGTYVEGGFSNNEFENGVLYEQAMRQVVGTWAIARAYADFRTAIFAILLGSSAIRFFRGVRAANTASTLASAFTGPGFLVGLIKWLVIEGGVWAAIYLLKTSEEARDFFARWIFTSFWWPAFASASASYLELRAGVFDAVVNDLMNMDSASIRQAAQDYRSAADMSPEDLQTAYQDVVAPGGQDLDGDGDVDYRGANNPDVAPGPAPSSGQDFRLPGMN